MSFWISFWTIIFFVSMGVFAIIAVVVAIGGFKDVKSMLAKLRDESTPFE